MPKVAELTTEYAKNPLGIHALRPRFGWQVSGQEQAAYRVVVSSSEALLQAGTFDKWDSGWVSSNRTVHVAYSGAPLESRERCYWRVEVRSVGGAEVASEAAWFELGLLKEEDWGAHYMGAPGLWPGRALLIRHSAKLKAEVVRARLYIAGLGLYTCYLNGKLVSDALLDPPPTEVDKLVPYTVHDLTSLMAPPEAVLVIVLGHGWYGRLIAKVRLEVDFADGTEQVATSAWDATTFKARAAGSVDGIFLGEDFDARLEPSAWFLPGDAWTERLGERHEGWCMPYRVPGPGGKLVPNLMEPMRITQELTPKLLREVSPGRWLLDAGHNLAGFCRIKVKEEAGTRIELKFAELLDEHGQLSQENLYQARCADSYICRGGGEEVWQPRFTYHGFRYVEISGLARAPEPGSVTVCRVRNDIPQRGEFSCDHELINAIHRMIVLTEESNEHGVLTDCPQRSERQGWLNDQTARAEQFVHNFYAPRFLAKWVQDFASAQDASGAIPDTVPWHWGFQRADPVCVCPVWYPWLSYRHYADERILSDNWEMMTGWQRCLSNETKEGILESSSWGDWCPPREFSVGGNSRNSAGTPGALVSTAHLIFITRLLGQIAQVLGKAKDSEHYFAEAVRFSQALHQRFYDAAGACYGENIQGANSLALWMGLVPEAEQGRVFARLAEDVQARGHITTGNICTKYLLEVLADRGRADLAFQLVSRREYPGWGYMLEHGATTMWERWEHETGAGMNSHNHSMMGAVDSWFYTRLVGILDDPEALPGDSFLIRPNPVPGLGEARAKLQTIRGPLEVSWRTAADKVKVEVTLPVGARARFTAPPGFRLAKGASTELYSGHTSLELSRG